MNDLGYEAVRTRVRFPPPPKIMPRKDKYESSIADYSSTCKWGWLAPDGKFHGCKPGFHYQMSKVMGTTFPYLVKKGWAQVRKTEFECSKRLTPEQREWLSSRGFIILDTD